MTWIEAGLSGEQRKALKDAHTNKSILASAGSGKTRSLIHLLADDFVSGISPTGIVAFTFTEKASEELLARIHALVRQHLPDLSLEGMYIGTIHSWCFQYLLKQNDFYNFTPMDELHVDSLVSRLYDYLRLSDSYGLAFPRAITKFLNDLELYFNENLAPGEIPEKIQDSLLSFLDALHRNRLLTFGSMIRNALEHLETHGSVSGLESLYVDEYQDVNPAQVALIKAMIPDSGKLTVVGDELQCIYNWRGSDIKHIINFSQEFNDASVVRLTTNYRSRPEIVNIANNVASNIDLRDTQKEMKSGRKSVNHKIIHWISLDSEEQQASVIAEIADRFNREGVPWNQIAVLIRSVIGWGRPVVDALASRGIPVQCPILSRGGEFINDLILPLFDWLRSDHREPKNEYEEAILEEKASRLEENIIRWARGPISEREIWVVINSWLDLINDKRDIAYNVRSLLYDFFEKCRICISLQDENLMLGISIATQIVRSVEEVHRRRLSGQKRLTPRRIMSEIYYTILRKQQEFGESAPIDTKAKGVLITTIHQAKGLEWPIVIIPMLSKGCFPIRPRGHESSFSANIKQRYGTSLEDERRLFYVAITRAKERLFLLDPNRSNENKRSVFIQEFESKHQLESSNLSEIDNGVWKLSDDDLKAQEPPSIRIGLSDLLICVECPYQYGLRRVTGIQPSVGEELGYGMGLHELIQRRFDNGDKWQPEVLRQEVEDHVNLPYMSEHGETLARQSIERHFSVLETLGSFSSQVAPELNIEIILESGIVHGVVDCVEIKDNGSLVIRDWKSNVHSQFMRRYERQLQFYTFALRLQGENVDKAEIVDVAASVKQRKIIAYNVDISEDAVMELIDTLNIAIIGISNNAFPVTPSTDACGCCDIYKICGERESHETNK